MKFEAGLRKLLPAAAAVVVLALAWWIYDLGKLHGATELESARLKNAMLDSRNEKLVEDVEALREQLAVLQRSSQIDRTAATDVRGDLEQLEEELQAAREQVEFYRGIVSPGDVKPGLRIHQFVLEPGSAAGSYHYELVLTQLKRNEKPVSGEVDWKVTGMGAEGPQVLLLADITDPPVTQQKFRFRYFQDLAGTVQLPDGFVADRVELSIWPSGKRKQEPVVQSFDWPATVPGGKDVGTGQ